MTVTARRTTLLVGAGIAIALATLFGTGACTKADKRRDFAVVGYVPEYRYGGIDWDAMCKHLTHAIFFSIEVTSEGELAAMDRFPNSDILARAHEAAAKYGTKLLICFGGNSRSGGFGKLVLSPEKRSHFVQNVMKLLDDNSLDGVDLNWEYPQSEAEWNGLFRLINELKTAFKPTGRVLTMAVKRKKIRHTHFFLMLFCEQRFIPGKRGCSQRRPSPTWTLSWTWFTTTRAGVASSRRASTPPTSLRRTS